MRGGGVALPKMCTEIIHFEMGCQAFPKLAYIKIDADWKGDFYGSENRGDVRGNTTGTSGYG